MLFLRRLLVVLQKLNDDGIYPSMNKFMLYLGGYEPEHYSLSAKWVNLNYILVRWKSYEKFKKKVTTILKDNLGSNPYKHFIDYHEDYYGNEKREGLAVTARGRELIKWLGFVQIVGNKFSVIWGIVGWIVALILAILQLSG